MNLSFYTVDADYCDYLRKFDSNVPYTMDKKANRPFVGVVFNIGGYSYYAPLTSPKEKHKTMKTGIDFIKINSGIWGAINLNNMIPVHMSVLNKIDLNDLSGDKNEQNYKNLLKNQLSWCNSNKDFIMGKAEKLYSMVTKNKATGALMLRCCNFKANEKCCDEYF